MISNSIMAPALTLALNAQRAAGNWFKVAEPQAKSRFEEAEELRAYAQRYADTDRSFADDLYAAADRHEGVGA